ncbi:hypothetical protein TNCT_383961 [Trichonephila clavata]|uniref:Uncharacterized protein n=1 Tax=Trichonephila clavata TaxID=2740835 RepID=A0A8X6KA44_TRICU|nr:hypothetical protein TNCT_383961 [Trichonephila clavata]
MGYKTTSHTYIEEDPVEKLVVDIYCGLQNKSKCLKSELKSYLEGDLWIRTAKGDVYFYLHAFQTMPKQIYFYELECYPESSPELLLKQHTIRYSWMAKLST